MKMALSIIGAAFFAALFSCKTPPPAKPAADKDSVHTAVSGYMETNYLWLGQLVKVDPARYSTPDKIIEAMKYKTLDRWSVAVDKGVFDEWASGTASASTYGFGLAWGSGGELRVAYVYTYSDAYKKGLRRGNIITSIGGINPQSIRDWDFFYSPSPYDTLPASVLCADSSFDAAISAGDWKADKILSQKVINTETATVGYIAYESFARHSLDSLLSVMRHFKSQGVTELVIDLRYNGGGEVDILMEWMDMVMPRRFDKKPFFKMVHNAILASKYDQTLAIRTNSGSLEMERVFVVTSHYTASASEALINCLKPYIDVHVIGQTTHGKPVGMYVIPYYDWYLMPVTFEYQNADSQGGFFNGIDPDYFVNDNISADWGDITEPNLAAALHYINTGSYPAQLAFASIKKSGELIRRQQPVPSGMLVRHTGPQIPN
jgi:carboxyl-terminal processing protease